MEIDLLIENPAWEALDLEALAEAGLEACLVVLNIPSRAFSLSLMACDDARIAELNAAFRSKPTPTNVLSWPGMERAPATPGAMPDLPAPDPDAMPEEIGDIAIAFETCAREAAEGGKPLVDHVQHLLVHGVMHCLGFDHETDADAALMESLESRILASLGVPDPY
ncbi:rRNA maturation RNase YbeY [Gymnodinialimonas ceratoperidinii]|uniref:Endoribonuclease YbeY n=1 Tax=Gymnodinialimonas ceratoperidinii TaxID=2856823 RepID=A0A8F6TVQ5_9RHOB|nr:rRNA maturation RNase YbeY [Gymnodinialimonas ceratoperidinii]QXT39560.1 rRNA maturation RNase YbeY [Gymnodinialimonas ceratoperidinii]